MQPPKAASVYGAVRVNPHAQRLVFSCSGETGRQPSGGRLTGRPDDWEPGIALRLCILWDKSSENASFQVKWQKMTQFWLRR